MDNANYHWSQHEQIAPSRTIAESVRGRQCGRKVLYLCEVEAKLAAKRLHKRIKAKFNAYLCQWCHGWHVGTVRSAAAGMRRWERTFGA